MKRTLALVLAMIMLAALLPVVASAETVTLRFWGGVPGEYGPEQVVARFNEEYKDKGIQAEYVRYVNDETGNMKLETTLLGGGEVDVFMTYGIAYLTKRGEGNMAVDLAPMLAEAGFDMVEEQGPLSANYIFDGKIYGIPTKYEDYRILANVDMFEEAGIELPLDGWTYSEFREACKKLTHGEGQDKVYGMYWSSVQEPNRPMMIAQTIIGDNYYYRNGGTESNFDDPAFVEIAQLIQDMMWVDGTTITHTDTATQQLTVESVFLGEKTAMSLGVWCIRSIKDLEKYPHDFETAYLPIPHPDNMEAAPYAVGDNAVGDYICISSDTKYMEEALEFVLWYTRGGMCEGTPYGRVPLNKAVSDDFKLEAYMRNGDGILHAESVSKFLQIPENIANDTITTKNAEIKKCLTEALELIYTNQMDAASALKMAKENADKFLK